MQRIRSAVVCLAALAASAASAQEVTPQHALTLDGARAIARQALETARRLQAPGSAIAVVDRGGNPLVVERLDGTFAAAATISIGKARTAALFQRPSKVLEDAINGGRDAMLSLAQTVGATPLQGGVPIYHEQQLVGAVGVSGAASAAQDEEIAQAAAAFGEKLMTARAPAANETSYLAGNAVRAAFAKGMPLVENSEFKVHASRREAPGQAEVHTDDTDVIYVLGGKATFITGGKATELKPVATGELRGAAIEGGESRTLAPGDLIIVPAGVPHWFKAVEAPFTYYVVKVTRNGGAR